MKSLLLIEILLYTGIGGLLGLFSGETNGMLFGIFYSLFYYLVYLFFKRIVKSGLGFAFGFYGCAGIIIGIGICGVGDLIRLLAYNFYKGENPVYFAVMKPRGKWKVIAPALSLFGPSLKLSNRPVNKIKFLANSNLMIATSIGEQNQETYSIWDMNDRHRIMLAEAPVAISDEGKIAFYTPGKGVQLMGWQGNALEILHQFQNNYSSCKSIQLLKNDTLLSAIFDSGTITLWDLTTGKEIHRFAAQGLIYTKVALSLDGAIFAAGSQEGIITIWSLATGEKIQQLGKKGFSSKGQVKHLTFMNDTSKIITFHGFSMVCWDINTNKIIYNRTPTMSLDHLLPDNMDGGQILGTTDSQTRKQIHIRDIQTGKSDPKFKKLHGQDIWSYELGPDKNTVFLAQNGKVTLYDLTQATVIRTQRVNQLNTLVPALAISPDGKTFATGSEFGITRVWRTDDGTCLQETTTSDAIVTALAFSDQDRGLLAVGDVNGRVSFWDINPNQSSYLH